jgi:hypothetical protein
MEVWEHITIAMEFTNSKNILFATGEAASIFHYRWEDNAVIYGK